MEKIKDIISRSALNKNQGRRSSIASRVFSRDELLEMVYDPDQEATGFVHWRDGEWKAIPAFETSKGTMLTPFSPRNNLLAHRVVLFPTNAEEYGSESELVATIQDFIHRYVDLSDRFERLSAYYVLLTWLYDRFEELPYLRVRGDPGTGKTRFLLTIGSLCNKPIFASGASSISPLFRILDSMRGTLVIDESDFRFSDEKAEFVKVLNNGNVRGFPVLRTETVPGSKEFNPRAYHVFGPKLVATRGPFDDPALESRFLTEETGTRPLRRDIPINLPPEHAREATHLRNRLLLFRFRNFGKPRDLAGAIDRSIEPRLNQIFAPLLSVVDDPETKDDLQALARAYHREMVNDRRLTIEAALLETIVRLWNEVGSRPSIREVTERFEERHGSEFPNQTPRRIGFLVRRKLGLETTKSNGVFCVAPIAQDELRRLQERFGLEGYPRLQRSP